MATLIRDLIASPTEGEVTLVGWVDKVKVLRWVIFVTIQDGTGKIQVTLAKDELPEDILTAAESLTLQSAVEIRGTLKLNGKVKLHGREIIPKEITVHNVAEPLPIGEHMNEDTRLDWRFLDLRMSDRARCVFEVQTVALAAMNRFWLENDFRVMQSPKIMGAASEDGGSELFSLDFFGNPACLAQSPQLYKQFAMAAGIRRYAEIGPVFRANPSFTTRHDAEFTSIDMEIAWINSHEDVMQTEERWIAYVLQRVKDALGENVKRHFGVDVIVPSLPFPRISMKEAQEIVASKGVVIPPEKVGDLTPEAERTLAREIMKRHGHQFVFVTDYPTNVRPFYHMRDPDTGLTKSFDLIWNGVEVTTGAQREHRYDILLKQAAEKGVDLEGMKFYTDIFRYGCPPHGGFGFGMTRMLMMLLGTENVREVTYIYRGPRRLVP